MSGKIRETESPDRKTVSPWQEKVNSLVEVTARSLLSLLGADSCYYLSRHGFQNHRKFILAKGLMKSFELKSGDMLLSSLEEQLKRDNSFNIKTIDEEIPAVAFRVFSTIPSEDMTSDQSISFDDRRSVFSTFVVLQPDKKVQLNSRKRMELEAYLASSFRELIKAEREERWNDVKAELVSFTTDLRQDIFCHVGSCLEKLNTPLRYVTGLIYTESDTQDLEGCNYHNGYLLYQKGKLFAEDGIDDCHSLNPDSGFLSISNPEESQLVKMAAGWHYLYNNSPETSFHYSVIPKRLFSFSNKFLDTLAGSYVITYPILRRFDQLSTSRNTFKGIGLIILPEEQFNLTLFRSHYLASLSFAVADALKRCVKHAGHHMIPAIIQNNISQLSSSKEAFCNSVISSLKQGGMQLAYFDLRLEDKSGKFYNFPKYKFGSHNIPAGFVNEFLYGFTDGQKEFDQLYYENNISLMAMRLDSGQQKGILFIVNGKEDEGASPQPYDDYDQRVFHDLGRELMLKLPHLI